MNTASLNTVPMNTVVSLIPSATEILWALGATEQQVGRSHECDFPESVRSLPVCTAPNLNPNGSSAEIDREVKSLLHRALSVYRLETGTLQRLRPGIVITQTQCEVCAVTLEEVETALQTWVEGRPRLVSLAPMVLDDLWTDILRVAEALGIGERGGELVGELKGRVDAVATTTGKAGARPGVACIEWIEPLMAGGNWIPEMVALAGGHCLFGEAGRHSPWISWQDVAAQDPDVLLLLPCGFDIERTRAEMHWLTERAGWGRLKAVRNGQVYLTDGNHFFNRSGPRLVESLEIMAEIFHPGLCDFGHQGSGWVRF